MESFICDWLTDSGGYDGVKVGNAPGQSDFDAVRALDTAELFAFVGATQAESWDGLVSLYGGDVVKAQKGFADRLARELDVRGTVDVLRHGVVDLGVTFRLAFFRPASQMSPELVERYGKNRLTVTRQLPYEPGSTKTLDLCLFVNGVPAATAELKNPLTGQTAGRRDRAVPHGPGPEEPVVASGGGAFRGGHGAGGDDDRAGGQGDPVLAVRPGP